MDIMEAMAARHSVRQYTDRPLSADIIAALNDKIGECNRESGLNIRLITDEPKAFDCFMARYGKFSGVRNYIALIGKKGGQSDEACGYQGERLALFAQSLGLNSCWVAMSYRKVPEALKLASDEKLVVVIALGYGENQGQPHKSRRAEEVSDLTADSPEWYRRGVEAALLAPTAMNQQKFQFSLSGGSVSAKAGGIAYAKVDLGIAKLHFELGAGKENFAWQ